MVGFKRLSCVIAILGVLVVPASGRAEPIAESVAKLSDAEIHHALNRATAANQVVPPYGPTVLRDAGKRAARGAIIGLGIGIVAGVMVNRYCQNERGTCNGIVLKSSAAGAGFGALYGALGAFR
jgi:hypothetical protein